MFKKQERTNDRLNREIGREKGRGEKREEGEGVVAALSTAGMLEPCVFVCSFHVASLHS